VGNVLLSHQRDGVLEAIVRAIDKTIKRSSSASTRLFNSYPIAIVAGSVDVTHAHKLAQLQPSNHQSSNGYQHEPSTHYF
jgi:hypothetical protein